MAKVITIQILVRDDNAKRIEEGLNEMLTESQRCPEELESDGCKPWLASWSIKAIDSVNEVVEQAVAADVEDLDSFLDQQFVICFAGAHQGEQFYSSTYGPASLELATKFSAASIRDELGLTEQAWEEWKADTKAYIFEAPYLLTRYTAKVFDAQGGEEGQLKEIELWAANGEVARDMVKEDHAHENIVSLRAS